MKKVKFDFCKRCNQIYDPMQWGQFIDANGRFEFCCVNCKDEFMYDDHMNVIVKVNSKYKGDK